MRWWVQPPSERSVRDDDATREGTENWTESIPIWYSELGVLPVGLMCHFDETRNEIEQRRAQSAEFVSLSDD